MKRQDWFCLVLFLSVNVGMTERSLAQRGFVGALGAAPRPAPAAQGEEGTRCTLPEFGFKWLNNQTPILLAKADPEGKFELTVKALPPSTQEYRVSVPGGIHLDDDWSEFPVVLTAFDLYGSNFVQVEFKGQKTGASNVCAQRKQGISQPIAVFERQLLRIDLGSVFSLEKDGSFDSAAELAFTGISRWKRAVTGVVDVRFSEIGALETSDQDTTGGTAGGDMGDMGGAGGMGEMGATGDMSTDEAIFNPFEEGGSVVRINIYGAWDPAARSTNPLAKGNKGKDPLRLSGFKLIGGLGFTTVPGEALELVEAKPRAFVGVRWDVLGYNVARRADTLAGTIGFIQFGFAQDELWEFEEEVAAEGSGSGDMATSGETMKVFRDETERWFLETQLEIPNLGSPSTKVLVRGFADLPTSGDGPSDVRISILLSIDPTQLKTILGLSGG